MSAAADPSDQPEQEPAMTAVYDLGLCAEFDLPTEETPMTFEPGDRVYHKRRKEHGTFVEAAAPDTALVKFDDDPRDVWEVSAAQLVAAQGRETR